MAEVTFSKGLWNEVAGGAQRGFAWRTAYHRQIYSAAAYRPFESLDRAALGREHLGGRYTLPARERVAARHGGGRVRCAEERHHRDRAQARCPGRCGTPRAAGRESRSSRAASARCRPCQGMERDMAGMYEHRLVSSSAGGLRRSASSTASAGACASAEKSPSLSPIPASMTATPRPASDASFNANFSASVATCQVYRDGGQMVPGGPRTTYGQPDE